LNSTQLRSLANQLPIGRQVYIRFKVPRLLRDEEFLGGYFKSVSINVSMTESLPVSSSSWISAAYGS
jgi:hypothetical protein